MFTLRHVKDEGMVSYSPPVMLGNRVEAVFVGCSDALTVELREVVEHVFAWLSSSCDQRVQQVLELTTPVISTDSMVLVHCLVAPTSILGRHYCGVLSEGLSSHLEQCGHAPPPAVFVLIPYETARLLSDCSHPNRCMPPATHLAAKSIVSAVLLEAVVTALSLAGVVSALADRRLRRVRCTIAVFERILVGSSTSTAQLVGHAFSWVATTSDLRSVKAPAPPVDITTDHTMAQPSLDAVWDMWSACFSCIFSNRAIVSFRAAASATEPPRGPMFTMSVGSIHEHGSCVSRVEVTLRHNVRSWLAAGDASPAFRIPIVVVLFQRRVSESIETRLDLEEVLTLTSPPPVHHSNDVGVAILAATPLTVEWVLPEESRQGETKTTLTFAVCHDAPVSCDEGGAATTDCILVPHPNWAHGSLCGLVQLDNESATRRLQEVSIDGDASLWKSLLATMASSPATLLPPDVRGAEGAVPSMSWYFEEQLARALAQGEHRSTRASSVDSLKLC